MHGNRQNNEKKQEIKEKSYQTDRASFGLIRLGTLFYMREFLFSIHKNL